MPWWGEWRRRSACASEAGGVWLQAADDLGEGGARVLGGDQVGQAETLTAGVQVLADLGGAADEDRGHLPGRFLVDAGPAALADQLVGVGAPPVREDEGAERAEFQAGEPV